MMMECCRFVSTGQRYNLYTPLVKFFGIFLRKKPNVPTLAREGLYDLHKRCINSQVGTKEEGLTPLHLTVDSNEKRSERGVYTYIIYSIYIIYMYKNF